MVAGCHSLAPQKIMPRHTAEVSQALRPSVPRWRLPACSAPHNSPLCSCR